MAGINHLYSRVLRFGSCEGSIGRDTQAKYFLPSHQVFNDKSQYNLTNRRLASVLPVKQKMGNGKARGAELLMRGAIG